MIDWVPRIGEYVVEREEGPRQGGAPYIPLPSPRAFIVHTTEGSTVDSAIYTLRSRFYSPHFVIGQNRIVQMRPLWAEAATLRAHNDLGWQVESVGFSQTSRHRITPQTWAPLVALTRFAHEELGVPLVRPSGWRDDLRDVDTMYASNNTRRRARRALSFRGVLGHIDIPDQDPTWHWDPGALDYTALFAQVQKEDDDMGYYEFKEGGKAFKAAAARGNDPGPPPRNKLKDPDFVYGWAVERGIFLAASSGGGGPAGKHRHAPGDIPHRHDIGRTDVPEALP